MIQRYLNGYYVDIVLCIDKTSSIPGYTESIKNMISSLPSNLSEEFLLNSVSLEKMRVKLIAFGDYRYDSYPMQESPFYVLPEQNDEMKAFLDSIVFGSSNIGTLKNALEAIATAIKSDWTTEGARYKRHIITVISDSPTVTIGERANCPNYPDNLPKDMDSLISIWDGIDEGFKGTFSASSARICAIVPKDDSWTFLEELDRTVMTYIDCVYFDELQSIILSAI